jgi:hypothetical protein
MSESMPAGIDFCCCCPFDSAFRDNLSARLQLRVSPTSLESGQDVFAPFFVAEQALMHDAMGTTEDVFSRYLTRTRHDSTQ